MTFDGNPTQDTAARLLRVGVVGCGMIGQDHIRRLTQVVSGAAITAVHDFDRTRAEAAAARAPGARVHDNAPSLIAAEDVDAVLVCSWGPAHEEAILPALELGKPVFCEKPLATSQEACLRIIEAEVRHGKRLIQVGYMRRYDAGYAALKQTIDSGTIGAPLIFHSRHRNASVRPDLYTSDMAVSDTMVHDIDVCRFLFGDEVRTIRVIAGKPNAKGKGLRDPILGVLEMAGGALATVEVSVNVGYGYDIGAEMSGENGAVSIDETNPVLVKSGSDFHGRVPADWRERFIEAYDAELGAWIEAALASTATGPSAWDGYAIQVVSDAGIEAANSGRTVEVRLADKPALYD